MAKEKHRQIRKPFLDLQEASVNVMNHTFPTGIISKVAGDIGTFSMSLNIHTANYIALLRHILKKITIFSNMPLHPVEDKKNPLLFKTFLLPQNIINFPKPVAGFPFPLSSFHPSPFAFYRPSRKPSCRPSRKPPIRIFNIPHNIMLSAGDTRKEHLISLQFL